MIKIDLDNDKQVDYICNYFKNEALKNKIEEKDKEIERLKEEIKGYKQERERVLNIIDKRNHKAIEYIEKQTKELYKNWDIENFNFEKLLNILKGVDKE